MKTQSTKRISAFIIIMIFTIVILLFNASCSKETKNLDSGTANKGSSKIIHTDVKPDSVIISTARALFNLDLDGDGIADFIFTETGTIARDCRRLTGFNGFKYAGDVRPAGNDARSSGGTNNAMMFNGSELIALDSLAVIDSNVNWTNDTIAKMLYVNTTGEAATCNPPIGPWNYTPNKYLGLKIIKKGNSYYGWVRIYKTNTTSMILTGYAYNSIPDQVIFAGQTK